MATPGAELRVALPGPAGRAPALVAERAGQGLYIVPDHRNVSGCFALFGSETVRIEGAPDPGPGLISDPLDQAGIADIFEKNRRNFRFFDLGDDPCDVAGAGLGFGRDAYGGNELDAIGGREIA